MDIRNSFDKWFDKEGWKIFVGVWVVGTLVLCISYWI